MNYKSITHIFETYGYYDYLEPNILANMSADVYNFLIDKKYSDNDIKKYLAVDIISNNKKDRYEVIAYNMVCALWMSNIFPKNLEEPYMSNFYETNDKIYHYNEKTNKLKVKIK